MNSMERRFQIRTVASAIIAINVVVFLMFNVLFPDWKTYLVMIKPLALTGDYWRFFTSMFAHADIMHLLLNMFCLYIFGQLTEFFFGAKRFIVIYLLSGIAGTALSILFSDYSSLGASGAIFGIVSANLYMLTKMDGEAKQRFASDLIGFIVINIGFSLFEGNVDLAAHIGGLIGGVTAGFALGHRNERFYQTKRQREFFSAFDNENYSGGYNNTYAGNYGGIRRGGHKKALGLLRVSGAFILVAAMMAGAFFFKMSKPNDYLTAIALRYEYYGAENARRLSEKAALKFPDHPDIREINKILNSIK